jgi:hypothetical protein
MSKQISKSSQHVYDYAIIGSGLTGLCLANALNKISSNILLIEASDTFGGFNRSITTPIGNFNNGLRFLPGGSLTQKAISYLELLLMTNLSPKESDNIALTYDSGALKNFLGFGDHPPAFYEEISYFAQHSKIQTSLEPHEWTQILFNNYSGEFMPKSYVTKINAENDQAVSLTINGQKKVQALNFIYTGPIRALKNLLPEDSLSIKARSKLAKNTYWTAVCLDILHSKQITESTSLHILNGTTQDEIGPCVGSFLPIVANTDSNMQYSQWLTFVSAEESEDTEVIGAALKKMKRQIKRAYENSLEDIKFERILVVPDFSGNGDLKLSANQTLPSLKNFWIASGAVNANKNILGSLLQAELVSSSLGCHPAGVQPVVEDSTVTLE